jgi:hypothetical protein
MTNEFRAMCAKLLVLAEESISYRAQVDEAVNLIDRARALLDQPEPEGPVGPTDDEIYKLALEGDFLVDVGDGFSCMVQDEVEFARAVLDRWGTPNLAQVRSSLGDGSAVSDEEIMELMPQQMRDDLAAAARALAGFDNPKAAAACRIILNRHAVDHARVVLAKYGTPTPQPVAVAPYREVADLVVWLEDHSAECLELDQPEWSKSINQAARFLHLYLRATPQPVAVSERLPRPEDCLDEGWAWFFNKRIGWRQAVLPVSPGYTHWLPANALPTPEAQ